MIMQEQQYNWPFADMYFMEEHGDKDHDANKAQVCEMVKY